MIPHRTLLTALSIALTSTLAACAADTGGTGTPGPGPGPNAGALLDVVGSDARSIPELSEEVIEVRYTDLEGQPIEGIVDFAIEGDPAGGTLSGHSVETDADGHARVTLRAGTQASYDVVAVAPEADPATVSIDVQQMRFAPLHYTVTYDGMRVVDGVEAALFTNVTCDDLSRSVPSPRETQVTYLGSRETFEDAEVGIPMAVYALGIDRNDYVAAEACADVTVESTGTEVEIPLDDVSELFGGTYSIQETFDVTDGFSEDLDTLLDVMGGLSSDPARYIVDFVADHSETPSWLRSALSSSLTRRLVADRLEDAMSDVTLPGFLVETVDLGGDMDRAFSALTLDGDLTFDEPDEFGESLGNHRVSRMSFPLDGATVDRPVSAMADVNVTVGPTITLDEHALSIEFGRLIEMILNDVLLPRLPGSPANIHDWLTSLLDCDGISMSLAGDSSTAADVADAVCDVGLIVLSGYLDDLVTNMWEYDTLHLAGTADLTDSDQDYDRDVLENGEATARWTGDSGELMFPGVLDGLRPDDETGRRHRVRERMHDLR